MPVKSNKLLMEIGKVISQYKMNDDQKFLKKLIFFMIDSINLIDNKYFILSKDCIQKYLKKAKEIWNNGGSPKELEKVFLEYEIELTKIKSKNDIRFKEHSAWCCMMTVLHNFRENPFKYYISYIGKKPDDSAIMSACRTFCMFMDTLPTLDLNEKDIMKLLRIHFDII